VRKSAWTCCEDEGTPWGGLGKRGGVEGHVRAPQGVAQKALARGAAHHGHALVAHRVEPGQGAVLLHGAGVGVRGLGVAPMH
jgi:hypothetical protein